MEVVKPINSSKLMWMKVDDRLQNITYEDGDLVILRPGFYFIYCHLQLYVANCSDVHHDLKLELCLDGTSIKESLSTVCKPNMSCKTSVQQELSLVFLEKLLNGTRISVHFSSYQYLDL
uniref:THD domain-containing protein n=1 Tax=Sphenodon punctatus TaxID=8508 RepID=A0A8D0GXB6_SPHPU